MSHTSESNIIRLRTSVAAGAAVIAVLSLAVLPVLSSWLHILSALALALAFAGISVAAFGKRPRPRSAAPTNVQPQEVPPAIIRPENERDA
jgi:hypothetical protein